MRLIYLCNYDSSEPDLEVGTSNKKKIYMDRFQFGYYKCTFRLRLSLLFLTSHFGIKLKIGPLSYKIIILFKIIYIYID